MGFLHSTKVQNKPHPLPHLSLLPSLITWLLATICPPWSSKTPSSERLPTRPNQLSYQQCFEQKQTSACNPVSTTVPKKDIIILLPYLGLQSNQVAKRLKSCVYKFYSCVNLKIVFQSTRCIKPFFPYKDRINRSQQSRVIYRANCWDCNGN